MTDNFFRLGYYANLQYFTYWLKRGNKNPDLLKQLEKDKNGNYVYGLFKGYEKQGLIVVYSDNLVSRQPMIEAVKAEFPKIRFNLKNLYM